MARVLAATLVVTLLSVLLDPELWREWIQFLAVSRADDSSLLVLRVVVAAGVVAVAARLDTSWLLPAAMWLAAPHFSSSGRDLTILAGTVRLWSWRPSSVRSAGRRPPDPPAQAPPGPEAGAPTDDRDA